MYGEYKKSNKQNVDNDILKLFLPSTDESDRRSGIDRRRFSYAGHVPERRCGTERRSGPDRKSLVELRANKKPLISI